MDHETLDRLFSVNTSLSHMRRQGGGRIIVTSSVTGPKVSMPGSGAYATSKAAVTGFIHTAAIELAADNITVNAIEPGYTDTSGLSGLKARFGADRISHFIPAKRLGRPEEIAGPMAFLASDEFELHHRRNHRGRRWCPASRKPRLRRVTARWPPPNVTPNASWSAKSLPQAKAGADHPRLSPEQPRKDVDGGPSPTMTVGSTGGGRIRTAGPAAAGPVRHASMVENTGQGGPVAGANAGDRWGGGSAGCLAAGGSTSHTLSRLHMSLNRVARLPPLAMIARESSRHSG